MEVNYGVIERYEDFKPFLLPHQLAKVINRVFLSERFEMDDLGSFVLLNGTSTPVGYIGSENAQLIHLKDNNDFYDIPRSHLRKIILAANCATNPL